MPELKLIDHLHLSQGDTTIPIHNNMIFGATGQWRELSDVLADIRMIIFAAMAQPKTYDVPGPIEIPVHPDTSGAVLDSHGIWSLHLPSVRAYFEWMVLQAQTCLAKYRALHQRAHAAFETLPDDMANAASERMINEIIEELPIRVFRDQLGDEIYSTLIKDHLKESNRHRLSRLKKLVEEGGCDLPPCG